MTSHYLTSCNRRAPSAIFTTFENYLNRLQIGPIEVRREHIRFARTRRCTGDPPIITLGTRGISDEYIYYARAKARGYTLQRNIYPDGICNKPATRQRSTIQNSLALHWIIERWRGVRSGSLCGPIDTRFRRISKPFPTTTPSTHSTDTGYKHFCRSRYHVATKSP